MKNQLKIMLLSSAFNGLTQRVYLALQEVGHQVSFLLFTTEDDVTQAVLKAEPDIVICPFLKDKVPQVLWENESRPVVIIHPGIKGDRGASALDWTIMNRKKRWGVTALQAAEEMDAGPIWASYEFDVPKAIRKSALYNSLVSDAALECVFATIDAFIQQKIPRPLNYFHADIQGQLQPNMKQADRHFSWSLPAEEIVRRINAAEGVPGVLADIEGQPFYVYDAYVCDQHGEVGKILARNNDAILIGAQDKSVWIGSLKHPAKPGEPTFKYPAACVLAEQISHLPDLSAKRPEAYFDQHFNEIRYHQFGEIGELIFDFYNGAMSTQQCQRAVAALKFAKAQKTKVLIIRGGWNAFSNGIHLNTIQAASDPENEAWLNIQAIDDVCLEILSAKQWVIVGMSGSAGAGGVMLGLTGDEVFARDGIVLNPHYATMGLYGSEYWTYTLPKRVGQSQAMKLVTECLPISVNQAKKMHLIDGITPRDRQDFVRYLHQKALKALDTHLNETKLPFDEQEALQCRERELAEMKRDILDNRHRFSQKRGCFVLKQRAKETPERLVAPWAN